MSLCVIDEPDFWKKQRLLSTSVVSTLERNYSVNILAHKPLKQENIAMPVCISTGIWVYNYIYN